MRSLRPNGFVRSVREALGTIWVEITRGSLPGGLPKAPVGHGVVDPKAVGGEGRLPACRLPRSF